MRWSVYPYKSGSWEEIIRLGFIKVLTGESLGKSHLPVKLEEFKSLFFAREDISSINSRVSYWFPFIEGVESFEILEDEKEAGNLGFRIVLKLEKNTSVEIRA